MILRIITYIFRFTLVFMFVWAGIEKLFLPYDPSAFEANSASGDPKFFQFYDFLQDAGYLYFVGFFQLLCGLLILFKRTYLLGSVMLVPLLLCLLMTHVFISKSTFYMVYDSVLLGMTLTLVFQHYSHLKETFLKSQNSWI